MTSRLAARRGLRLDRLSHAVLIAAGLLAASAVIAADTAPAKPLPIEMVDTLNKLSGGPHAGFRANHAKGLLLAGTFTPAETAATVSKAVHFGTSVPVLVRMSNATGVPNLPDADGNASPHGIAIRFMLQGGGNTDIVGISANDFPVATPEDFLGLLKAIGASGPDAPKPTPIEQFLASHAAATRFVTTPRPAPVSFATLAFYGVNAFKFTNAKGVSRFGRYQIIPVAGEQALSAEDAAKAAPDYLMAELPQRIAKAPVKFKLRLQLANAGDSSVDPTSVWPADREVVELGTITLNATPEDQAKQQKALLFNPLALVAGIEPSADPVLLFRPGVYGVSYGQRAGN